MATLVCPSISDTTLGFIPEVSNQVAAVWRRSTLGWAGVGVSTGPQVFRRLCRERSRQPEPREHVAIEAGHRADPVAGEGEDEEAGPVADARTDAQVGPE